MALEQEGFRWRDDNGAEEGSPGASYLAAQDSNISIGLDTPVRLRTIVNHTSGAAPGASNYRLEYRKVDSPTPQWAAVGIGGSPSSSERVRLVLSSFIASGGENTTAQLIAPAGSPKSFTAGKIRDDVNGSDSITVGLDQYTELEWCLEAVSANGAQASDVYEFRVTRKAAPSGTTFEDTFDRANGNLDGSTSSDTNFTWAENQGTEWEIVSNTATCVDIADGTFNVAATSLDAPSDNYFVQATITSFSRATNTALFFTLMARGSTYDSTPGEGQEGYGAVVGFNASNAIANDIQDFSDFSSLDNDTTVDVSGGGTLRLEVNGTSIRALWNSVEFMSVTDATYTGGVGSRRAGIAVYSEAGSANDIAIDNFSYGDL